MPDGLIRDIPTIQRRSLRRDADDLRFLTHSILRLERDADRLEAVTNRIVERVTERIDCTSCANCCKTLVIAITSPDAERLARRLGMPTDAFIARYVRAVDSLDGERTLRLNSPPCPFLSGDNLCTVYEDRPMICRDYPGVVETPLRSRVRQMIGRASECPIAFNAWQRVRRELRSRRLRRRRTAILDNRSAD